MDESRPGSLSSRGRAPAVLQLSSEDPSSTRQFLETVFGWNFGAASSDDGIEFEMPDGGQGRLHPPSEPEDPDQIGRIRVVDLSSTLERAQRAGGSLLLPRVDAPGMGSFFMVRIPGGPILTCWEAEAPSRRRPR